MACTGPPEPTIGTVARSVEPVVAGAEPEPTFALGVSLEARRASFETFAPGIRSAAFGCGAGASAGERLALRPGARVASPVFHSTAS
jgi:hypothetical protein